MYIFVKVNSNEVIEYMLGYFVEIWKRLWIDNCCRTVHIIWNHFLKGHYVEWIGISVRDIKSSEVWVFLVTQFIERLRASCLRWKCFWCVSGRHQVWILAEDWLRTSVVFPCAFSKMYPNMATTALKSFTVHDSPACHHWPLASLSFHNFNQQMHTVAISSQ
jgi:hypothetical protein